MPQGPVTYRDHMLSIYQSAAAEVARQSRSRVSPASVRARATTAAGGSDTDGIEAAAAQVAGRRFHGLVAPSAAVPRAAILGSSARSCAELALRYLDAKLSGEPARIAQIAGEFTAGTCDPAWATTLNAYLEFFGPGGTRHAIPYVRPAVAGERVIEIKAGAKVALVSDWGTGADPATRVLRQIAALKPDVLIHLGDIYYSGTPVECDVNFQRQINAVLGTSRHALPVFALAGNHDMYCGGIGYYGLIEKLNPDSLRQSASFFCLRSSDESWQILAMDTGLHDYSPLGVQDAVTFLEEDEIEWHRRRVKEFRGRTLLLSHHQLFSAFSPIGPADANGRRLSYNPKLRAAFDLIRSEGPIAAWFWGHEHSLGIYEPHLDMPKGRCIGHGAVPVFTTDNIYVPVAGLEEIPTIMPGTQLAKQGSVWAHGFSLIELGAAGSPARADYYQDLDGKAVLQHSETII